MRTHFGAGVSGSKTCKNRVFRGFCDFLKKSAHSSFNVLVALKPQIALQMLLYAIEARKPAYQAWGVLEGQHLAQAGLPRTENSANAARGGPSP
jgi:hypothetical protein